MPLSCGRGSLNRDRHIKTERPAANREMPVATGIGRRPGTVLPLRPQMEPTLRTLRSQTPSLQYWERISLCCLSHSVCDICYGSSGERTHDPSLKTEMPVPREFRVTVPSPAGLLQGKVRTRGHGFTQAAWGSVSGVSGGLELLS